MSVQNFGPFTFNPATCALYRKGTRIDLPGQPARVLGMLLANRGHVVTRDQLRVGLWGDKIVEFDTGLNYCMHQLRKALGDDAKHPTYIETVAGEGYRFVASVTSRSGTKHLVAVLVAVSFLLVLLGLASRIQSSASTSGPVIAIEFAESSPQIVSESLLQETREAVDSALNRWTVASASPSHLIYVTPERASADSLDPIAWRFGFSTFEGDPLFSGTVKSRGLAANEIPVTVAKGITEAIEAFLSGPEPGIHRIQRTSIPAGHLSKAGIEAN